MLVPLIEIVHKEKGAKGGPSELSTARGGSIHEKDGYILVSDDDGNAELEHEGEESTPDGQQ